MRNPKQPARELRRVVELFQILIGFQENILAKIESVLSLPHQSQEIIEDTLFPARHEHVVGIHVPPTRLGDQVAVLNLPKDQTSAPILRRAPGRKRRSLGPISVYGLIFAPIRA